MNVILTLMVPQLAKYSLEPATAPFQESLSDQTFNVSRKPLEYAACGHDVVVVVVADFDRLASFGGPITGA